VFLAMERREVDGICESLDSIKQRKPEWIPNKVVNVLLQAGSQSRPELKDVPNVLALEWHAAEVPFFDELIKGYDGPMVANGRIRVPDGPGLGIELDEGVAYRYRKSGSSSVAGRAPWLDQDNRASATAVKQCHSSATRVRAAR
jgi:hypothetical protein